MTLYEQQQAEIATIKERTFVLKLSDADVQRIFKKAGGVGLTVPEMLQSLIGDLVDGTYSNGSDERDYAQRWLDRCGFGTFPECSFPQYLIQNDVLDSTVMQWNDIQMAKKDLSDAIEQGDGYGEAEGFKEDIADWSEEINEVFAEFKKGDCSNQSASLEEEMEKALEWQSDLKKMLA